MATKSKIELLLELSDKMFNNGLTRAQDRVEKATKGMQKSFDSFKLGSVKAMKEIQGEIPLIGRAMDLITNPIVLASAALVAIGGIMAKGVASAEKFDSAFLPIRQLNLDKSTETMDKYRNSIRDAAYEVGANLEKSTNAMYDLQSGTGMFGDDAIAVFKKVAKYSWATGADINESMNASVASMKAFGIGVEGIDDILASNAKTVQMGITTFDELARVQAEFGGSTAAIGQTVDTGNKLFAMFTSMGGGAAVASTKTKSFFEGLGQQASKIEDTLKIKVFDTDGSFKDADKLLVEISEKFSTMNEKQISETINKIGGPDGLRGALAKAAGGSQDMINTFNGFDSSAFNMEAALKNAEGDSGKMKELFFNRMDILLSKLGEKIIPIVMKVMEGLAPLFEAVFGLVEKIWPIFEPILNLIVWSLGLIFKLINWIIKGWDDWGAAVTIFMGPIGFVILAFQSILEHWNSITEAFKSDGILGGLKRIGLVLLDVILKPLQQILETAAIFDFTGLAQKGADKLQKWRASLDLVTPGEKEPKEKEAVASLYGDETEKDKKTDKTILGDQVTTATGQANQVRTTNISIESFIKGNVGMTNNTSDNVTIEDLERMLQDLFLRMVINAERT